MTERTKAERIEAGKKAAATRARNEAKASGRDLKNVTGSAGKVAVDLGKAVVGTTGKTAKAVGKQAARLVP